VLDSDMGAKGFRSQKNRETSRYRSVVVSDIISVMQNIVSIDVCYTKERSRCVIKAVSTMQQMNCSTDEIFRKTAPQGVRQLLQGEMVLPVAATD
jgi:uncharacterized protein (DUF111 family)